MGLAALPYHWLAERYPARRTRILRYWVRVDHRTTRRYKAWRKQQAASHGGLWGCVATHEEGGSNTSSHGYFGFMGSPAAFGWPQLGASWSGVSWAQQVTVAEGVLAASGSGAWGPLTRAACF